MSIIIDDQYRNNPRYEQHFDAFCERLKKHNNDIPIFVAGPCKTLIYVLKEITEV